MASLPRSFDVTVNYNLEFRNHGASATSTAPQTLADCVDAATARLFTYGHLTEADVQRIAREVARLMRADGHDPGDEDA